MEKLIIYNGSLIPESELRISALNRGMMYGDGCFDTLRSYKGKFLHLKDHFERFIGGANHLGIQAHFRFEDFRSKLIELLKASKLMEVDALIRVQCWREGERGYRTDSMDAHWVTTCVELERGKEMISLSTVNTRAIPSSALERKFKLSNGLNYVQAAREAMHSGAQDALMLTIDEKISETTIANIFWIQGNTVFTPSGTCDLFPGITRNIVINLIRETERLILVEGEFVLEDIKQAEAVFTTNSIKEIVKVRSVDNVDFNLENEVVQTIQKIFGKYRQSHLS